MPLMGPGIPGSSANPLELSFADRFEHYSDFGSTNNPKVGLVWRPTQGLKLRGTYGTSFKAPLLNDLNPVPFQVAAFPTPDPRTGGFTNVLAVFGGNPVLQPEKAKTWTVGVDWTPKELPGLRAAATYYEIRFKNRITDAQLAGFDVFSALQIEDVLGPSIVQRNPSLSAIQQLFANPGYTDFCQPVTTCDPGNIGAIIDVRSQNLSLVKTSGLDLGLSYNWETTLGQFEAGVDGTYIFNFDSRVIPNAPFIKLLNTPYNPVDLKLRGRLVFQRGGWTAAAFVNYVDSYTDIRSGASTPIRSWTTGDASIAYRFGHDEPFLRDVTVTLSVLNITNEPPPRVLNDFAVTGINFDAANANTLGRFVSLLVSKAW